MKYFANVTNFEDLKAQYRTLALANHPDMGGDLEVMKAINNEYDALFPVWKYRANVTGSETAASTRSEFYTQNGWKGENYNPDIGTKEIASIIREYVKDVHNDYRFSIKSEYDHLWVTMTEAPAGVFTNSEETHIQLNHYYLERENRLTNDARDVMSDILNVLNSYRMDDSDSMIDYFNTNFYISLNVGNWEKPLKIVPRQKTVPKYTKYETVEVTKTRTFKTLEPREIPAPTEFTTSQYFLLKSSFSHGCYCGAVYMIDSISDGGYIRAYKMGKGYKNICKGDVRGNRFFCTLKQMNTWIEKEYIVFAELIEVTKTEEYTSSVRRPKKTSAAPVRRNPMTDNILREDHEVVMGISCVSGVEKKSGGNVERETTTMQVVVVEPGKPARSERMRGELKDMQKLVGGSIEAVHPFADNAVLICNEEGKLLGLPPNRTIGGEIIAGTFFLCAETKAGDDFTSLDRSQMQSYLQLFRQPERFDLGAAYAEPMAH